MAHPGQDLRQVIELSPISIYLLSPEGCFHLVNQRLVDLVGFTREELLGSHFSRLIYPFDLAYVQEQVRNRFSSGEAPKSYEFRVLTHTQEILYCQGYFSLLHTHDAQYILGQIVDITEKKYLELKLRRREDRYRVVLENSGIGYFEVDLEGNPLYLNTQAAEILKYHPNELEELNYRAFVSPEMTDEVYAAFHAVYRTGETRELMDIRLVCKDGEERIVQTSVDLIQDEHGQPQGFRGILRDVTELKKAEQILRQSEEKYRTIFEGAGVAMLIINPDTTISMVNKPFEQLSGYVRSEIEGKMSWKDFASEHDLPSMLRYHYLRRVQPGTVPTQYEFVFVDRCKEAKYILATVNLMDDNRTVASFLDMTERKNLEKDLRFLSLHDTLTGLYNRHYFEQEMSRLMDGRQCPLGLIVCDVDGLKEINDSYGHKKGDAYLQKAANILANSLRKSDMVARIGGDEFAIVLPRSSEKDVQEVLSKIKRSIDEHNVQAVSSKVSISLGYAMRYTPFDSDQLFKEADQAMYADKQFHKAHKDTKG